MTTSQVRAMVRAMQAAGCPAEQIVAAVVAFEDGDDAREAERRARDRDRKRAERAKAKAPASEPVGRTDADVADSADMTVSPRPSPEVSPKENNQTLFLAPNPPPFHFADRPKATCVSVGKSGRGNGFAEFWQAMPSPNPATKAAAMAAFARLSPDDQVAAIAAAGRYASAYAAKPTTHPLSPARFLRDRCFEGYGPPGGAGAGVRGGEAAAVFVRVETPQWRAWQAYRGRPIPLNREGTGWHFPTAWPPQREGNATPDHWESAVAIVREMVGASPI